MLLFLLLCPSFMPTHVLPMLPPPYSYVILPNPYVPSCAPLHLLVFSCIPCSLISFNTPPLCPPLCPSCLPYVPLMPVYCPPMPHFSVLSNAPLISISVLHPVSYAFLYPPELPPVPLPMSLPISPPIFHPKPLFLPFPVTRRISLLCLFPGYQYYLYKKTKLMFLIPDFT